MKRMKWLLLGTALLAHSAFAGPVVTFTLGPLDGVLAGPQGTSVGWGYTISTDSGFLLVNSITFQDLTPVGTFWTPGITSAIISDGSPVTVPWIEGLNGLQYDIDPGATVGSQTTGWMDLNYEWFADADLNTDLGAFDVLATDEDPQTVIVEVDVQQGNVAEVPEPGCLLLCGAAVLAVILRRSRADGR
jgi:hypothetical protein